MPERCHARKPWNRSCDMDDVGLARSALADEDMPALRALEGKTVRCWEAMLKIKPKFTECPRDSLERCQARAMDQCGLRETGVGANRQE